MMLNKSIYLIYSHDYNAGYVGKAGNLIHRFYDRCYDKRTCVKQFCDGKNVKKVRDIFCIYEIIQCDKADAAYYEGHIYDLIEAYFPQITLISKISPTEVNENVIKFGVRTTQNMRESGVINGAKNTLIIKGNGIKCIPITTHNGITITPIIINNIVRR